MGLVLIGWVGPKVNGLDLGSELDPNLMDLGQIWWASRYEVKPNLIGLI